MLCHCDCGNVSSVSITSIRRGISKKCMKCAYKTMKQITDNKLIGKTFGSWKVVERDYSGESHRSMYFCICGCGTRLSIPAYDFISGRTNSCKKCCIGDLKKTPKQVE